MANKDFKLVNFVENMTIFNSLTVDDNAFYIVQHRSPSVDGISYLLYQGRKRITNPLGPATNELLGGIYSGNYISIDSQGNAKVIKADKLSKARKIGNAEFDGTVDISNDQIGIAEHNHDGSYLRLEDSESLYENIDSLGHDKLDKTENAVSASVLANARNLTVGNTSKSFNGSANVTWSLAEIGALPVAGGTMTDELRFANDIGGIRGTVGSNDHYRIFGSSTGSDQGYMELATGDNGNEPIYVRQYSAGTLTRTLTLLNGSGNSVFPGSVTASSFIGNASTATTLATSRTINGVSFNGSANIVTNYNYTAALTTTWSGSGPYTQTVTVTGILATDNPIVDIVLSTTTATAINEEKNWAYVSKITTAANSITVTCNKKKPTVAMNIQLKVVR